MSGSLDGFSSQALVGSRGEGGLGPSQAPKTAEVEQSRALAPARIYKAWGALQYPRLGSKFTVMNSLRVRASLDQAFIFLFLIFRTEFANRQIRLNVAFLESFQPTKPQA